MTRPVWSPADVPLLRGRRALITGVTSGLGEHVAVMLARAGAEVVLAGRDPDKLEDTLRLVADEAPDATLHPLQLDLADLSSVRRAAEQAASLGPLTILVNNAGVMGTPYEQTVDGFELQMGTNHLGHFALTGLLLPQLMASGGARVVTVSSLMARTVRHVPADAAHQAAAGYRKWRSYSWSKLANLLFTMELDRRVRARRLTLTSVAAHPGYAATNLVDSGVNRGGRRPDGALLVAFTQVVGQSPAAGAAPVVMAATSPGLRGGTYVGPDGPFGLNGSPRLVDLPRPAHDEQMARELWEASEEATGVRFP